jgi:hypothetical protein
MKLNLASAGLLNKLLHSHLICELSLITATRMLSRTGQRKAAKPNPHSIYDTLKISENPLPICISLSTFLTCLQILPQSTWQIHSTNLRSSTLKPMFIYAGDCIQIGSCISHIHIQKVIPCKLLADAQQGSAGVT